MMVCIQCAACGSDGHFPVQLKIEYRQKRCGHCNHVRYHGYDYHFCATDCLNNWIAEHSQNGVLFVPCQPCNATGFAFGFEENGPCANCEGQKEIKVLHSNARQRT